jgi:hypothetical protein
MATRICFIVGDNNDNMIIEKEFNFQYFNGFALSQKQKSINSLHESIKELNPDFNILEISTKSPDKLGVSLSAFNLKFYDEVNNCDYTIENIFQSSKVFENGGPYIDLLYVQPKDAKRDERLRSSGKLKSFQYNNVVWELEPKTMFYDWIYIKSLYKDIKLSEEILKFDAFTDIEFNQKKSINCQARSAAIFVSLKKQGLLEEAIKDKEIFKSIYFKKKEKNEQMSFIND